ncbi:hypothetical protein [Phytoactinopolyspora limicola]|uniref:hypothetical protein n=1 Tax=Phytoactinopolyspora limicola TaxID=2715536 RepID=UPI001408F4C2|nr:hypothetical protein [Phytoactinopolyspora limicola]
MFMEPEGPQVTDQQARELDDSFFTSRPFGYFTSRIAALISASEPGVPDVAHGLGAAFLSKLGFHDVDGILAADEKDRALQIATDAFAVRHHAAEALVRLYHALAVTPSKERQAPSVWVSMVNGPRQMADLVGQAADHLDSDLGASTFWSIALPIDAVADSSIRASANKSLNVMASWLRRAMLLLTREDINIDAAHNKLKHGLAVAANDNERAVFVRQGPTADGTIPLSALNGPDAFNVIDAITLRYLAVAPKTNGRKQGLEMSVLRLIPATLLAEAWMVALTHGVMFHLAAERHFKGRDVQLAECPKLPLGPTPEHLARNAVVGLRYPVTTPPGGGAPDRRTGIATENAFVGLTIDFTQKQTAVVVDDG